MAPQPRLKKGNIFIFLLLIAALVYFFNRQKINQKLTDIGIIKPKTEEVKPPPPKVGPKNPPVTSPPVRDDKQNSSDDKNDPNNQDGQAGDVGNQQDDAADIGKDKNNVDRDEINADTDDDKKTDEDKEDKAKEWDIVTKHGHEFVVGENNEFQILIFDTNIDVANVTPVFKGMVTVEAIDNTKGQYTLKAQDKGEVELMLMGKVNGKIDILGTKMFKIVEKPSPKAKEHSHNHNDMPSKKEKKSSQMVSEDGFLWNIETEKIDTLLIGNNLINIHIAEVDARNIKVAVSGKGNTAILSNRKTGQFRVNIKEEKPVTITVRKNEGGNSFLVGEKTFTIVPKNPPKVVAKPKKTPQKAIDEPLIVNSKTEQLYEGISYDVDVSEMGINPALMNVSVDNGTLKKDGNNLIIKAKEARKPCQIKVFGKGGKLIRKKVYQVKKMPMPTAFIDGQKDGMISAKDLQKAIGINILTEVQNRQLTFSADSYKLKYLSADGEATILTNRGASFSPKVKALLQKAKSGDLFYFSSIMVTNRKGDGLKIKNISVEVE